VTPTTTVAFGSRQGRLVLAAAVTASGIAFLDGTVVNVALPRIGADLGGGFATLQWVVDAYLLTLGSLVLVGGALGDLLGRRRVFDAGIAGFGLASLGCALAPTAGVLVGARAVQGVAAALLVPGSLSLMSSLFEGADRGRAIGAWSGLSGVFSALGPFVGGFLVASWTHGWRLVFLINVPLVVVALTLSRTAVPDLPGTRGATRLDVAGATLVTAGLALVVYPLIEWVRLSHAVSVALLAAGALALAAFLLVESRSAHPMLPLSLFRVRTFTVANAVTFVVYAALGAAFFLLVVTLQLGLGYSPLQSGAAGIPITLVLLLFSSRVGGLVPRLGGRLLLTVGCVLMAWGLMLLGLLHPGSRYLTGVLPGVLVFAAGLVLVVAPVTTTVLGDVGPDRSGVASGTNNAVARIGSLIAIAVLPLASGLSTASSHDPRAITDGFHTAMIGTAGLCLLGGLLALVGLPSVARARMGR
jgi:EmrB/QacA subfamily drug resistance transporter